MADAAAGPRASFHMTPDELRRWGHEVVDRVAASAHPRLHGTVGLAGGARARVDAVGLHLRPLGAVAVALGRLQGPHLDAVATGCRVGQLLLRSLAVAVLVLRFTAPEGREWRIPLNFRIGKTEIPLGAALIAIVLLATALRATPDLDHPHPDTEAWARRGLRLAAGTSAEQLDALRGHPDCWLPSPTIATGAGSPCAVNAAAARLSPAPAARQRLLEATGFLHLRTTWAASVFAAGDAGGIEEGQTA